MADATSLTPPKPGLSATLLSNKCWTLQSQQTRKCKNNNTIVRLIFNAKNDFWRFWLSRPIMEETGGSIRENDKLKNQVDLCFVYQASLILME